MSTGFYHKNMALISMGIVSNFAYSSASTC